VRFRRPRLRSDLHPGFDDSSATEIGVESPLQSTGTYLSRAELQPVPVPSVSGIAGEFLPTIIHTDQFAAEKSGQLQYLRRWPADTWLGGRGCRAVVHWIGQYEDDKLDLVGTYDGGTPKPQTPRTDPTTGLDGAHARKITDWTTLD